MAKKLSVPITTDPNDPILALWMRWKGRIYAVTLGIFGLIGLFLVINYFKEAGLRSDTQAVLEVRDAASPDGALERAADLSGAEAQATGLGIALQRYIAAANSAEPTQIGETLQNANRAADRLESDYGSTLAGKLVTDGAVALGHEGSGTTPAAGLASYADKKVVDSILTPPTLPETAPKVSLQTTLGKLEIVLATEQASELCQAFQAAVQANQFEGLVLYKHVDTGRKGAFQFGDARIKHDLSMEALPATSFWGRGPNLAPIEAKPNGLSLWSGWVGALVDPRTGKVSAREIVVATEPANLNDPFGGNQVIIPFGHLTKDSLDTAKKIAEALDAVEKESTEAAKADAAEAGAEVAPTTKTERPYFGEPKAAQ